MSAAQALTTGLPSSPSASGARSASGGERGEASFRETLDSAARSDTAPKGDRKQVSAKGARGGAGERDANEQGGSGAHAVEGVRGDAAVASELAQMLARLSGAVPAVEGDAARDLPPSGMATVISAGDVQPAQGPWFPGQVTDGGETLDAEQLRALVASASALESAEHEAVALKATVTRQETHLALETPPSGALAMPADGDATGAEPGAARVAEDRARSVRMPGGDAAPAAAAPRGGAIGESWSGGGSAFADQGIAGQDGRPADGRGSSGTGGQQQPGSGTFVSMLASGAAQAARAAGEALDAGFAHDPVSDQIASHVRAELKAGGLGEVSSDGVVKVLELELRPANLGSVTVRLALKDNQISIHIEAQRLDTLAVIEREREALAGALAAAGYSVDGITAAPQSEVGRPMAALMGQGDSGASASQGGLQGQPGQGQGPGTSSSGGQGRPGETGSGHAAYRHPSDDKDTNGGGIRRDAGGIYV